LIPPFMRIFRGSVFFYSFRFDEIRIKVCGVAEFL
jgi:hypothetical protein